MKKRIAALSILIITAIMCFCLFVKEYCRETGAEVVEKVLVAQTEEVEQQSDTVEIEETVKITAADIYTEEDIQEAQDYLQTLKVDIPQEIINICEEIGSIYGICPEILESMCWCETRCTYKIISAADAYGIMQVCPKWHTERMTRLGVTDLFDPYQCILTGADYLTELSETYPDINQAITAYNQGYCNGVTNDYSQKVADIARALECVHNK